METIEEFAKFKIVHDDGGLFGLIYRGKMIEKCEYNEITHMDEYFLCRKAGLIKYIDFDGETRMTQTSHAGPYEEKAADDFIIVCNENQMQGLLTPARKEILPVQYDEVFKWPDCDVISARKGNKVTYFNTGGEQILINVKKIKGAKDRLYPYYVDEPQTNVVQLMDMSSSCDGDDYCQCHGVRAGLSRRLHEEHAYYVQRMANVVSFTDKDIDSFLAWDCYIFASFAVDSDRGVIECINRLKAIGCFDSSWYWNFLVLLPTRPSKEEIDEIKWIFNCLEDDSWSQDLRGVAFGVNENVKGVKIIGTRYVRDHWPTDEDWDDSSRGEHESIQELKDFFNSCYEKVKERRDETLSNIIKVNRDNTELGKDWNIKREKLELMLSFGAVFSNKAVFDLIDSLTYGIEDKKISALKTLQWLLEHGANVNGVRHGQSSLDILNEYIQKNKWKPKDAEAFRNILLNYGAKHAKEIREEECRQRGITPAFFFTNE